MPEIKLEQLLLIAGFILPGAISMYVYGLKVPQKEFQLKDRIAEAICYSLLNFVVVGIPIQAGLATDIIKGSLALQWLMLVVPFVIVPVMWPFMVIQLLHVAERNGWIAVRAKTAWDDFFGRQKMGCWLQVELLDGKVIGGRYGKRSFASSWPDPGHLYLEEIWAVDPFGKFQYQLVGNPGVLLRPGDYRLLRVYAPREDKANGH